MQISLVCAAMEVKTKQGVSSLGLLPLSDPWCVLLILTLERNLLPKGYFLLILRENRNITITTSTFFDVFLGADCCYPIESWGSLSAIDDVKEVGFADKV